MGYFGGTGAGQRWHKLNVLPDLELLATLLDFPDTMLYYGVGGVPRDKPFRTIDGIVEAYCELLRDWQAKEENLWQYQRKASVCLATKQNHLDLVPCKNPDWIYISPNTPHVNFGSCYVWVDHQSRVSTAYGTGLWMGMQISYPRVFSDEWTRWESVLTIGLPEHEIFNRICMLAKEATKPLVLDIRDKKVRTAIRVSPSLFDTAKTLASEFVIRQLHGK